MTDFQKKMLKQKTVDNSKKVIENIVKKTKKAGEFIGDKKGALKEKIEEEEDKINVIKLYFTAIISLPMALIEALAEIVKGIGGIASPSGKDVVEDKSSSDGSNDGNSHGSTSSFIAILLAPIVFLVILFKLLAEVIKRFMPLIAMILAVVFIMIVADFLFEWFMDNYIRIG